MPGIARPREPQPDRNLRSLHVLIAPGWLGPSELRIGLGCMRLSTDPDRDEERAFDTIAAAAAAGVTVFDTARAYGHGDRELGHNERLLVRALRRSGAAAGARIVTKGGMRRAGTAWAPDGRAKAIRADCEASLASLDGLPVDLYLIHAPIRGRPGGRRSEPWLESSTSGRFAASGCRTSTAGSSTRRSSSHRSPRSRCR